MPPSARVALGLVLVLECMGALGLAVRGGQAYELWGTGLALAASLLVVLGGRSWAAYGVAGWFLTAALLKTATAADPLTALALVSQAARYGVALAVALPRVAGPILRAAACLTFAGHGLQAIGLQPIFVEYLQSAGALVGVVISAERAAIMLWVIGTVDLLVAASLLRRGPRLATAGYMSVWGTLTALVRIVHGGPVGVLEASIRAANAGAPLALWLGWRHAEPDQPQPTSPP